MPAFETCPRCGELLVRFDPSEMDVLCDQVAPGDIIEVLDGEILQIRRQLSVEQADARIVREIADLVRERRKQKTIRVEEISRVYAKYRGEPATPDPCDGCVRRDGNRCVIGAVDLYRFDTRNFPELPCDKYKRGVLTSKPTFTHVTKQGWDDMVRSLVGRVVIGVIPGTEGEMTILMDWDDILGAGDPPAYLDLVKKHVETLIETVKDRVNGKGPSKPDIVFQDEPAAMHGEGSQRDRIK